MMSSTINRNVYALALINLLHWLDPEVFLISLCFYVEKYIEIFILTWDFPSGSVGKESSCPCRRCGLHLWAGKIPWGRRWWPTPVFLLGEFHGQRRLVDYSPWGHKELDMTEHIYFDLVYQNGAVSRLLYYISGNSGSDTESPDNILLS